MTDDEIVEFCRTHGACNVDVDREIGVAFALDLMQCYFTEHPADGVLPKLRDVFRQIEKIEKMLI